MGVPLLHPWANRLAEWDYEALGRRVDLRPLEGRVVKADGGTGLPMHGVLPAPWDTVEATRTRLVAERRPVEDAGFRAAFPFPHRIRLEAELSPSTLRIATTLEALDGEVPVAFGFHPYVTLPDVARADYAIELPAMRRLALDARKVPTGEVSDAPAFAGALGDRDLDDGFDGVRDGATFAVAGGGRRFAVHLESGYPCAQVFAPPGKDLICFEPMTAPGNALRTGAFPVAAPGRPYAAAFSIAVDCDLAPAPATVNGCPPPVQDWPPGWARTCCGGCSRSTGRCWSRPAPVEILAHRIAWSVVFVAALLALTPGFGWVRGLGRRRAGLLTLAAVLVTINWGAFIYGVNTEHVVETSLGYFINPLVTVALAVTVLGERLRARAGRRRWRSRAAAVVVLDASTTGARRGSRSRSRSRSALYGLVKKRVGVGGTQSLAFETAFLFAARARLRAAARARAGEGTFTTEGAGHALLLAARRHRHRGAADAVRRRRGPDPADDDRAAAVPRADHAVRDRRAHLRASRCRPRGSPASRWSGSRSAVFTYDAVKGSRRARFAAAAEAGGEVPEGPCAEDAPVLGEAPAAARI